MLNQVGLPKPDVRLVTQRKNSSSLSPVEQAAYHDGVTQLVASGAYADLVRIHADIRHDQHGGMAPSGAARFLSWHRDFLLKLESQLQAINGLAFIPYWDWAADRGLPSWVAPFLPVVPMPTRRNPIRVQRSLGRSGRLASTAEVNALIRNASLSYDEFTQLLEGFHDEVHRWVGGTMGIIGVAPADPMFWMHHANVDRIWAAWQATPGNGGKKPTLIGKDAILDPWKEKADAVQSMVSLNYTYV